MAKNYDMLCQLPLAHAFIRFANYDNLR